MELNAQEKNIIMKVNRAANRAFRESPWESKCYDKALTVKWMLGRRKIKSTIYFGVAKDNDQKMKAHAWLRSGNRIVTGREGMRQFTVVEYFS